MFGNLFDEPENLGKVDSAVREYAVENLSNPDSKLAGFSAPQSVQGGFVLFVTKEALSKSETLQQLESQSEQWKKLGFNFALALDHIPHQPNLASLGSALAFYHHTENNGSFVPHINDPQAGAALLQTGKVPLLSPYSESLSVLVTAALCARHANVPLIAITDENGFNALAAPLKKVPKKKAGSLLVEEALSVAKNQLESGQVPALDAAGLGVIAQYGTPTHVLHEDKLSHVEKIANGEEASGIVIK